MEITRAEHPSKCFIWVCEYVRKSLSKKHLRGYRDMGKKGRTEEKKQRNWEKMIKGSVLDVTF